MKNDKGGEAMMVGESMIRSLKFTLVPCASRLLGLIRTLERKREENISDLWRGRAQGHAIERFNLIRSGPVVLPMYSRGCGGNGVGGSTPHSRGGSEGLVRPVEPIVIQRALSLSARPEWVKALSMWQCLSASCKM